VISAAANAPYNSATPELKAFRHMNGLFAKQGP